MQTKLLSEAEFQATFGERMLDVTATVSNVLDIWPYVARIPSRDLAGHVVAWEIVHYVYRNERDAIDHVLVGTYTQDVFVVVVVNVGKDLIVGHYLLDLNRVFGFTSPTGA